jgi:hypothetical protein
MTSRTRVRVMPVPQWRLCAYAHVHVWPESRVELEAFAEGFTKYLADHPEEEADLGPLLKVLPVNGKDILGGGMRAYFQFSYAGASGLSKQLDAKVGDKVDTFKYAHPHPYPQTHIYTVRERERD